MKNTIAVTPYSFLTGGGEMGALTRAFDWSQTPLGAPDTWPPSLRTTLGIVLSSRFPMFLWWGPELIQFYNDAYRLLLGNEGKHPAVLGSRGNDSWPETWHVIKPLIDQAWMGEESTWSENQLIPLYRNGRMEDAYWTFSFTPVRDEAGQVSGILVVCTETTDKVVFLQKAQDAKEQLQFAIDAAELGTWDLDPLTNKFTGNERLKDWFGLPPEAEIPLPLALSVITDEDRQRVTQAIWTALEPSSGGRYEIDYTIVHPQSRARRIVRAKGKAYFDEQGTAYRFNGTLQDITSEVTIREKLIKTNEELTKSIREFTFVTDFMPQIVWATQPDGTHDFYNQRWYDFTGLSPDDSMGEGWAQVLHPDDAERTATVWQTSLRTGRPYDIEYRMRRHDGQYRWLLARALPLRDTLDDGQPGRILRWFGTCTDIHDQKSFAVALEEQVQERTSALKMANFDLQRSNENLERFAYVASHDLQEPLRKIQSFSDLLITNFSAQLGEGRDYLERMQIAAGRMSALIKDLLAFSRIRTHRDSFQTVSLTDVVQSVLTDLELAIQESGTIIELGPLPSVQGDSRQLSQLFQNLLSNAIKFRQADVTPCITITSRTVSAAELPSTAKPAGPVSGFYEITVADNGIGFDEKYLDRIFQVFQRLHGRSRYTGTGIGLAIVQKVVDNHGGAITATSQLGTGTRFMVYLPV